MQDSLYHIGELDQNPQGRESKIISLYNNLTIPYVDVFLSIL
jgi:hypothetical protein